jgi:hypothetical protein
MNRKKFLKLFGLGIGAVMIAPALIAKENINSVERSIAQTKWIDKQEWDFAVQWAKDRDMAFRYYYNLKRHPDLLTYLKKNPNASASIQSKEYQWEIMKYGKG